MPEVVLDPPLVRKVGIREYIYDEPGSPHKMGEVMVGDIVVLDRKYNEWYRIDPSQSQLSDPDLRPPHNVDDLPNPGGGFDYDEYWILDRPDGFLLPVDEPEPEIEVPEINVGYQEVGQALQILVGFIRHIWHS